jgi:hypothetical protein
MAGKNIVIIPDNDKPGREYAETVASVVTQLDSAATVQILDLSTDWPELPNKGDLADWCEAHDSTEPETLRGRIEALASKTEPWVPNAGPETSSKRPRVRRAVLQRFSEVEPETLRWLWLGRIPSGMLTVVSGNPAGGKSFLVADMVARVSTGTDWPDGSPAEEPGDVIMVNVEDAVAIVQRPRLDAAKADVGRVLRIDSVELSDGQDVIENKTFCIMEAAEVLRSALEQLERPRLVTLDPLAAFLAGVRSNDQGEIRSAFSPLVHLAEEFDVAIVFVHHNRKGTGSHSSEKGIFVNQLPVAVLRLQHYPGPHRAALNKQERRRHGINIQRRRRSPPDSICCFGRQQKTDQTWQSHTTCCKCRQAEN